MNHVCGPDGGPSYPTIDSLFDAVQHAITREPDQLTVSYDSEFGYPTNVTIDYSNSTDDEYTLKAQRLLPSLAGCSQPDGHSRKRTVPQAQHTPRRHRL